MTTTPESRESVEQLARRISANEVGGYNIQDDTYRVSRAINDFLRSHNIDPATMKPMENGENVDEELITELAEKLATYANGRAELNVPSYADTIEALIRDVLWQAGHIKCITNPDAHRQAVEGERIVASESAWLIEQPHANGGSPLWYAGVGLHGSCKGLHGWTYDACKAMRFPTKADAEKHIESEQLRQQAARLIATEHQFDTFGPAPTDEQVDQYLADAGIDMTDATQRLRKMVDEAKARATPAPPTRDVEQVKAEKDMKWLVTEGDRILAEDLWKIATRADGSTGRAREMAQRIAAALKPLRDEHERVKAELSNEKNTVQHKHDAWQDEKRRRIYYQNIVYYVCNKLDKLYGTTVCCGSLDEPSTEVQDLMARLISTPDTTLQQQLTYSQERVKKLIQEIKQAKDWVYRVWDLLEGDESATNEGGK